MRSAIKLAVTILLISPLWGAATRLAASEPHPVAQPGQDEPASQKATDESKPAEKKPAAAKRKWKVGKWESLFDGKTLTGWEETDFGGQGEIEVKDGRLLLNWGNNLTGIHTKQKTPKNNYEIELECMRVDGSDFFCGLTFPIDDSSVSLIVGGWGGGVCGISSIDRMDASENETTSYQSFKNNQWYRIRVRVANDKIEAWIDDEQIVDVETKDKRLEVRSEVELSMPLGIATWQTSAAIRKFRMRKIDPQKVKPKKAG